MRNFRACTALLLMTLLAFTLRAAEFSLSSGTGAGLRSSSADCEDVTVPVYRPYNTFRKLKLATAFFVNPEVADSARVLSVYDSKGMTAQDNDLLWSGWKAGTVQFLVPTFHNSTEFVPITRVDANANVCSVGLASYTAPRFEGRRTLTSAAVNKQAFVNVILTGASRGWVIGVSDDLVLSSARASRVVSWGPTDSVTITSVDYKAPK